MLNKIIKIGFIDDSNVEYAIMRNLLININKFIEENNLKEYQISAEAKDFCRKYNKRPTKPVFIDIFSDDILLTKPIKSSKSFKYLISSKEMKFKQSYNKKYDEYILSLQKYIFKNIKNGYIYAQLMFDLKEIVEYFKVVGYSLNTLFDIKYIYEELHMYLAYNFNT